MQYKYENGNLLILENSNEEKNSIEKEYYDNGKLKYKGQFLEGKKNGKCVEYYDNGNIEFEGEYQEGKRNGKGKE